MTERNEQPVQTADPPEPHTASGPILEPLMSERPVSGYSIVTVLIVINVVIFVLQASSPQWHRVIYGFGALQTLAVVKGLEYWRLLTAQYLHASVLHLALNMIALHFLGRPLERMWSARKFFAVYTACGLAGNIFFAVLGAKGVIDPRQAAVGASGSIYGLLGIVAVLFPRAEVYVYYLFPVKIRVAALVLGAIAFMSVIERGSNYGGEACHLAGLAFGVWWALHGDEWWRNTEWALPWQKKRG